MSNAGDRISQLLDEFRHSRDVMVTELSKVVIGQHDVIEQILASIFTRGHVLLVGVPGLAKTLMVSSLAKILDVGFKRIQFTPDLMPSDITGTNVLEEPEAGRRSFRFVPGPIFSNIILADEINRTPPKTQAALLQAMQEREVTVGQETLNLPDPFFVIATQNPIEQEGTYPLPEAQLDRFMFDVRVGYPSYDEEKKILSATTKGETAELKKVLSAKAITNLQKLVTSVPISDYAVEYVTRLVRATRPADEKAPAFIKELVDYGAGPRAGQNLILGGKAMAAMDGRFSVSLDDIRKVAIPVLRHRISTNFQAQAEGQTTESLIKRLVAEIREPDLPKYERRAGTDDQLGGRVRDHGSTPDGDSSMARIVYRGGSDSDDNLTPRPGQDEKGEPGRSPGISAFESIDQDVEPGGKAQGIDIDQLGEPLRAFADDPDQEGGVIGHLSIAPATSDGQLDRALLGEWAATRKSGRVHWLTILLRNSLVRPAIRRPR